MPRPEEEWREAQEHRFDQGYWIGGRIHPFLRKLQTGPSKPAGYVYITIGILLIGTAPLLYQSLTVAGSLITFLLGVGSVAIGVSNIRHAARSGRKSVNGRVDS
jgi:hypothetical protein